MKKILKEFKEFAVRGNAVSMAVGIVVGGAFTAIVNSLVENLINPLIGLLPGWTNLDMMSLNLGGAEFKYGAFLSAVINFILIAFVLFVIVKALNKLVPKKEEAPAAPTTKTCPFCKSEIALDAVKCPHCTSELKEQK